MKKSVVAAVTAVAVAAAGVVVPAQTQAQGMIYAELYQSWESGASSVGPIPVQGSIMNVDGIDQVESITEISIGESPYPGITIEMEPINPNYPSPHYQVSATGGKIYPHSFGIPVSARINYKDGSFEYFVGETKIYVLDSLVADRPAEPVLTNPTPTVTVTETVTPAAVTTTVTEPAVTTTVTKVEPTTVTNVATTTVTSAPAITTVTQAPVTTTVKATETTTAAGSTATVTETVATQTTTVTAAPVTTTVTAADSTATVTPAPATVTSVATTTVQPTTQDAPGSSDSNNLPGIIAAIVALIAAIGGGAYFMMNSAGFSLPFL